MRMRIKIRELMEVEEVLKPRDFFRGSGVPICLGFSDKEPNQRED